ncbi:MAG: site-specific integrase [Lachnospiraceae bacterium]|nr:site-specific integrase [Lachnospiraceae bacterium]
MPKQKKRNNGYLQKTFMYKGKRYWVYGKNTEDLFEKEKKKREELEKGFEQRDNPTVNEYYKRWTEGRRDSIKESTLRGQQKEYNVMSMIYIPSAKRTFGELKLKDVTIDDLRSVQSSLHKNHKSQTTNDYLAHLKHVFNDAVKERIIEYNPCILLNNLKITEERSRDTNHRALSVHEQQTFFGSDLVKASPYYDVLRLAVSTGMRIGEIAALKNSDIRDGFIHIERTITRTESGAYRIGDSAKTEKGKRTIPITKNIREIIEHQKRINALQDGNVVSMDNLIFRSVEGKLLTASPVDRAVIKLCKALDIEPFTCHALRATFATRAIESGMNPRTLQEIMGHANFNLTMSLYGHVLSDTKVKAMNRLKIKLEKRYS